MPTVPTSFVPQVAPQGGGDIGQFQAPQVAVTENLAAQQQVRFGAAMTGAGNQMFRLGSAIQDGIDEAEAKAADIAFIQQANTILRGEQGYLRAPGKNAVDRYAATVDALTQAGQETLDSLQNDTQKSMFRNVLARNMMTFQTQVLDHRDKEVRVFAANESRARVESQLGQAVGAFDTRNDPNGPFAVHSAVALKELEQSALFVGMPLDSEQFKQTVREFYTQRASGVVDRLMLNNSYEAAYQFVQQELKAERLSPKGGEALLKQVDVTRDRYVRIRDAQNIMQYGRVGSPGDKENNSENAPETLRERLEIARLSITDPGHLEGVQEQLRVMSAQKDALERQEYRDLLDSVNQTLASGKTIADIPPKVLAALQPSDLQQLYKGLREQTTLDIKEAVARNPAIGTLEWIDANRHKMDRETLIQLLKDANAPEKIIAATLDADQVEATFLANGMTKLTNPRTDDEKNESLTLRNMFKAQIDDMQSAMKRPLNRTEKQRVLDQVILQYNEKVYEPDWVFDNEMRLGAMTPEQRQTAYVMVGKNRVTLSSMPQAWVSGTAIPAFRAAGVTNPTMQQIADYWLRKGRPTE